MCNSRDFLFNNPFVREEINDQLAVWSGETRHTLKFKGEMYKEAFLLSPTGEFFFCKLITGMWVLNVMVGH